MLRPAPVGTRTRSTALSPAVTGDVGEAAVQDRFRGVSGRDVRVRMIGRIQSIRTILGDQCQSTILRKRCQSAILRNQCQSTTRTLRLRWNRARRKSIHILARIQKMALSPAVTGDIRETSNRKKIKFTHLDLTRSTTAVGQHQLTFNGIIHRQRARRRAILIRARIQRIAMSPVLSVVALRNPRLGLPRFYSVQTYAWETAASVSSRLPECETWRKWCNFSLLFFFFFFFYFLSHLYSSVSSVVLFVFFLRCPLSVWLLLVSRSHPFACFLFMVVLLILFGTRILPVFLYLVRFTL